MNELWRIELAEFGNSRELPTLVELPADKAYNLCSRYKLSSPHPGNKIDTERGLGTLGFADMQRAGLSLDRASAAFRGIVHEALCYLALLQTSWKFHGSEDQRQQFFGWLGDGNEHVKNRRVQELLGLQGRSAHRFLVMRHGDEAFTTNDQEKIFDIEKGPVPTVIDAHALANKMLKHRADTLFIAYPAPPRH